MQQETSRSVNLAFAVPLLSLCLCVVSPAASAADWSSIARNPSPALNLTLSTSTSLAGLLANNLVDDDCEEEDIVTALTRPAGFPSPAKANTMDQDGVMLAAADKKTRLRSSSRSEGEKAAADTPPSPPPAPPAPVWEIVPTDGTLNGVLARWAVQAGWQLSWELPVDYSVEARTSIPGSFEEAVEAVAKSMDKAEIPLKAIFYKGNKVLRIVAKGVE